MIKKSYEILKKPDSFLNYNLFLLYGENEGLKQDIGKVFKNLLNKNNQNVEFLSIYESEIIDNDENLYNSIYSGSLFSQKKIINIKSGSDKILKQMEDIVDKCPKNIIIIIFSDVLDKKSKLRKLFEVNEKTLCIPCYLDNEKDLIIIAVTELKKNNIVLSRESLNLLVEKSNNDRNNLKNEIEKIIPFSLNKKKLEFEEMASIINFSGDYKSDNFVNECLCGNLLQFKKIISEYYATSVNYIFILRILSNKIQRLLNIKEQESDLDNLDNLINTVKPPIFWKEKTIVKKQLLIWNVKDLKKIIYKINETELLCKTKPQLSKTAFFKFFTELCKRASSYS